MIFKHTRIFSTAALICAPALLCAPSVRARTILPVSTAQTSSVRGIVFDSVAKIPIAGAVVEVASVNPSIAPYSDTTDANGHFRFDALPLGRYVISFDHAVLRTWRIEAPLRPFTLSNNREQVVDLAIPSGGVVHQLRCSADTTSDDAGLITGTVREVGSMAPRGNARVQATWSAVLFDGGKLRTETQRASATSDDNGQYSLCGVPVNAPLEFTVQSAGMHNLSGNLQIPTEMVLEQNILLADSTRSRGDILFRGIAKDDKGKIVSSGRVTIAALAIDVPIVDGAFTIPDAPAGTWLVNVKAIGYAPSAQFATITADANARNEFIVSKQAQSLDAVNVVGTASRETTILADIIKRHQSSSGTYFLPGNPALQAAMVPTDVVRAARGFRIKGRDQIAARGDCASQEATPDRRRRGPPSAIAFYLNGERLRSGIETINRVVNMDEVLAIETFPDRTSMPVEMRTNDVCAAVSVWTKRR